jgi:hypothetical protein
MSFVAVKDTVDEAEAAAQADYAQRIRSAITTTVGTAEPGYVAGFEACREAALNAASHGANIMATDSGYETANRIRSAIAALPAPATVSTKLIEPIDCAGTRGARAEALKSHASMLATATASGGEEVTVDEISREIAIARTGDEKQGKFFNACSDRLLARFTITRKSKNEEAGS